MSELEKDLVFAGVDTHKDTHTLCLLDHMGRAIGTFRFAADAKGYDAGFFSTTRPENPSQPERSLESSWAA